MKPELTVEALKASTAEFARIESAIGEPAMYGVTDGKAIGTHIEQRLRTYLQEHFTFRAGNSAKGIDFPELRVDLKTTSGRQPQSSCPFRSARQKVFGLGYALLVLVYDKTDDHEAKTGRLDIKHGIFVEQEQTADYQTTRAIREVLERDGNKDDILALIADRNLPLDEIGASELADEILGTPPEQGYLTISNALQWRLQYARVIEVAGTIDGVHRLR